MGCNCNKKKGGTRWEVYLPATGQILFRNAVTKTAAEAIKTRYGVGPDGKPRAAIREVKA